MRALPSCHRNEQKEVGGWRWRRVGRREGRRRWWGAGSWLLQLWRCCCLPERAVQGTQQDRAPSPGTRPPPCLPPRRRRRTASPSGPGLAQRGQCAPTCPWLGTKTGPGRHPDGDGWSRLHGEWGPRAAPAFLPGAPGSKQRGQRGQGQWMGGEQPASWRHSSEPGSSPSGGLSSVAFPLLHFHPSPHHCHRS